MRSSTMFRLAAFGLATAFALGGLAAEAGELKLSTVRVDLNDRQPSMAMTITNVGNSSSLVHFRTMSWSQANASDSLSPTREVIANPPMAEIPPGGQQLVRIGYAGKMQREAERSYRLLIEEVPKKDRERTQAVETYLKISVPVFVAALAKGDVQLQSSIGQGPDGQPVLMLRNSSAQHLRLIGYGLSNGSGHVAEPQKGLHYVLPGATKLLPLDGTNTRLGQADRVELMTDGGKLQLPLTPVAR